MKLTIPVRESLRLHALCSKAGFTGATIYPGADCAGKAVILIALMLVHKKAI